MYMYTEHRQKLPRARDDFEQTPSANKKTPQKENNLQRRKYGTVGKNSVITIFLQKLKYCMDQN